MAVTVEVVVDRLDGPDDQDVHVDYSNFPAS